MNAQAVLARLATFCMLFPLVDLHAQVPHIGRWISREVSIDRVSPGCEFINEIESSYDLAGGINGATIGTFRRIWQRHVWSTDIHCQLPAEGGKKPVTLRFDSWGVMGEYANQTRQNVSAAYLGCQGDCKQEFEIGIQFQMHLIYENGELLGQVVPGITNTVKYESAFSVERNQVAASSAYWPLFKPLTEGNCNQFVNKSLDADTRTRVHPKFCEYGYGLAKILPKVFTTEPVYAFAATLGTVRGVNGPIVLRSGDVLVARMLVWGGNEDGGVFTGAVMRKQADGTWKIADLVFL
ncbi:hypothetical protein NHH73_26370 [Oxalobacteraceae bacterium OTU3CINTB1]|nr:hypothetical protein NHH73_26370 [Oxalobacteraceae bacterium OTU3CINTB1]